MILSILICSIPTRREKLDSLCADLRTQIDAYFGNQFAAVGKTEILVDSNTFTTVGEKRNNLLRHARGKYLAYCDDDDEIAPDYIRSIIKSLEVNPDCCSLRGIITTYGGEAKIFEHSIDHKGYFEDKGIYYRPPNHLNVIRAEIAKQFVFPEKNFGEDTDWAMQICNSGLLKTEAKIDHILYYYKFIPSK